MRTAETTTMALGAAGSIFGSCCLKKGCRKSLVSMARGGPPWEMKRAGVRRIAMSCSCGESCWGSAEASASATRSSRRRSTRGASGRVAGQLERLAATARFVGSKSFRVIESTQPFYASEASRLRFFSEISRFVERNARVAGNSLLKQLESPAQSRRACNLGRQHRLLALCKNSPPASAQQSLPARHRN